MTVLWQVQMVSDIRSQVGVCHSTPWMIAQVICLWEELVTVHEDAEVHFRLRADSGEMWRSYLESRLLHDPDTRVCVALDDTQVIGFLVARLEHPAPMFCGDPYGFISDSFVRPEFRRQGVTTELFRVATKWLASRGVHELQLDVYNRNTVAYDFWQSKGFRPMKTRMVCDLATDIPSH